MNDLELKLTMAAIYQGIANLEREAKIWRQLLAEEHERHTGHNLGKLQRGCWVCGMLAGTVDEGEN